MRRLLALVMLLGCAAMAQEFRQPIVNGQTMASVFDWNVRAFANAQGPGQGTITMPVGYLPLAGGPTNFEPWAVGVPVTVNDGDSTETVTITASTCTLSAGTCTLTATFAHAHQGSIFLTSGTRGLQEAIDYTEGQRGGTVLLSPSWRGADANITSVSGYTDVLLHDVRNGSEAWYGWNGSAYGQIFSADAAGIHSRNLEQVPYADQWCSTSGTLDQTCLANAANSAGAKVVDVPTGTYTVSASVTFPAGVTYRFEPGAILSLPLGVTATFAGPVVAPNQQIFSLVAPVKVTDAAMASGSSTVTSASGLFTSTMVGAPLTVFGCSATTVGSVHEACHGTITGYTSATQVTASFTNASGGAISGKTAYFGGSYVDFATTALATGQLNVRWWGAAGDGATDDTNALQEAMTAGEQSNIPVYASPGTYLTGNIQLGDPSTQNDWDTNANVHLLPGIAALEGAGTFQTAFKAKTGTTGYVLARENRSNVILRDFMIDGANTAGGCLDDAWLAVGSAGVAPAADQVVSDIRCINFTGTSAYGIWADNQNDSKFDDVLVAGPNGSAYDFYADAPTGWFNLVNSKFYSGKVAVSAQNATFSHDLFFGGFESIGQGINDFDFTGTQFGPAADTGVNFNSTNSGASGTTSFHCAGCWAVAGNGQAVFAGKFYLGGTWENSNFLISGTGSMFGAISTCCSPFVPTFRLTQDMGVPSGLAAPANANLITSLNDNAGAGTISPWTATSSNLIYSANNTGIAGILSINTSASSDGQSPLDFTVGNTMEGRIRADFTGVLNLIAGGASIDFWTGGDAGTGSIGMALGASGLNLERGGSIPSGQTLTNAGAISGGTVNATTLQQGGIAAALVGSCGANQFLTGTANSATQNCAQPSAANLSNGTTGTGAVVLSTSPTITTPTLSNPTATNAVFNTSLSNSGTALKHVRVLVGCTTGATAGSTCTSGSLAWPGSAFADTNYTMACSLESPTGVPAVSSVSKSTGTFTVTIAALTAAAATGTVDCIAMHD